MDNCLDLFVVHYSDLDLSISSRMLLFFPHIKISIDGMGWVARPVHDHGDGNGRQTAATAAEAIEAHHL